ncbi:MAG: LysR family transcriptional regulator [Faecousia sp.]
MELRYLQEFVHLTGTLSYSETAYQLNMSQSALSRHIQMLERELGELLFVRTTRSIGLSDFGRMYLPHAQAIIGAYVGSTQAVKEFRRREKDTFTLGVIEELEFYDIDHFVIGYQKRFPNTKIDIVTGKIRELEKLFDQHVLNVYTSVQEQCPSTCRFLQAGVSSVCAVVSSSHELARSHTTSLAAASEYPLFLPDKGSLFHDSILRTYEAMGLFPRIQYSGTLSGCLDFVREGMGIALFPREYSQQYQDPVMKRITISPEISCRYGLVFREELSESERSFVNFVRVRLEQSKSKPYDCKLSRVEE